MDITVTTSDETVQATEIAEVLTDDGYFVASVKVYRRETRNLQDEWSSRPSHDRRCDRDLCHPDCQIRKQREQNR